LFALVTALSLLVSGLAIGVQGAGAAAPTMSSSFQVLNLSATDVAAINIFFYNQDGTLATMEPGVTNPQADTVAAGASNTYYGTTFKAAPGFNGSVVIDSSIPVVAISNLVINTAAPALGSYVGFLDGASPLYFPQLQKGNFGYNSSLNIQNTTAAPVTISIDFAPASPFVAIPSVTGVIIPPYSAQTFDQATMTQFASVTKWVGSATVNVTAPVGGKVAGIGNIINSNNPNAYQLLTYNAFTAGSTTVMAPLVQENNSGSRSSINCQNLDPTTTTTLTATYTGLTGAKADESHAGVGPLGMTYFIQVDDGNLVTHPKFVGSATITANPAVPVACVVNQTLQNRGWASAYEGFDPAKGTDKVVMPLVQSRNGRVATGWVYSSVNVATVNKASTTFTLTYQPAPGFANPAPAGITKTGSVAVFPQNDVFGDGSKFVGGATVTADTPIVAVVNQARDKAPESFRDDLSTYDGFNLP
jgi:hypothetical protein